MNSIESALWNFHDEEPNQQMYRIRNMIRDYEASIRTMQKRLKELEAAQCAEIMRRSTRPDND